eukprot:gene11147-3969_t
MNLLNKIRSTNSPKQKKILPRPDSYRPFEKKKEVVVEEKSNETPLYQLRTKTVNRTPKDQLRKKQKNRKDKSDYENQINYLAPPKEKKRNSVDQMHPVDQLDTLSPLQVSLTDFSMSSLDKKSLKKSLSLSDFSLMSQDDFELDDHILNNEDFDNVLQLEFELDKMKFLE